MGFSSQWHQMLLLVAAVSLLCAPTAVHSACCTLGQPQYNGVVLSLLPLPTCSDGPCSGTGYDYLVLGSSVSESPEPESCCQSSNYPATTNFFFYNPQLGTGLYWAELAGVRVNGTGRTCTTTLPRYECNLGGEPKGTCQDTKAEPGPQPYLCPTGTVRDPRSVSTNLTSVTCCLPTCQDTNVADGSQSPYMCSAGLALNTSSMATTIDDASCCLPTCQDTSTGTGSSPYACKDPNLVLSLTANSTNLTDESCCLRPTCADTDPNTAAADQFEDCGSGYAYNSTKEGNFPPSSASCCSYVPTCRQPSANSGDSYKCPGLLVFVEGASNSTDPSDSTCCQPTCGDTSDTADGNQEFNQCPEGYEYDKRQENNTAVSNTTCCSYTPTCGRPSLDSDATYDCPGLLAADESMSGSKQLSVELCCKPTCGDISDTEVGNQEFNQCPTGYEYDKRQENNTAVSNTTCCSYTPTCGRPSLDSYATYNCPGLLAFDDSMSDSKQLSVELCCKPTCGDTSNTEVGNQEFNQCPTGYEYNKGQENNTVVSNTSCCSYTPTCGRPSPDSDGTYDCPGLLAFDASMSDSKQLSVELCCKPTCGDASDTDAGNQPFDQCPTGYEYDKRQENNTAVSNTTCCSYTPTCGRPSLESDGTYDCPGLLAFDASMSDSNQLSVELCCKPTCGDTSNTEVGNQEFNQCPTGYEYNKRQENNTAVSNTTCCSYTPTCGRPSAGSNATYDCPGFLVFDDEMFDAQDLTDAVCCQPTCGDTDDARPGNQTFSCPEGFEYDTQKDLEIDVSNGTCCVAKRVPTCAFYTLSDDGDQLPWTCPNATIPNDDNAGFSPASDQACCLPTCKDANVTAEGEQAWSCGAGTQPNMANALASPPSDTTCCKPLPTCADTQPDTAAADQFEDCESGYTYNSTKGGNFPPNSANCCSYVPTCGQLSANSEDTYICPGLLVFDEGASNSTDPSDSTCCQPTCGDTSDTDDGNQPFDQCPTGYEYNERQENNTVVSNTTCCSYTPTCGRPSAGSNATYDCPGLLAFDDEMFDAQELTNAVCCQPTCGDTDDTRPGNQTFSCPEGFEYDTQKDLEIDVSNGTCCVAKRVPTCAFYTLSDDGDQLPWTCPNATIPNEDNAGFSPASDQACCLPTCKDANVTAEGEQAWSCGAGTQPNMANALASPPSDTTCCKPLPTCADTQPDTAGPQAYVCNETLGFVTNPAANASLSPSNSVCCLRQTCQDTDPLTPGQQSFFCENGTITLNSAANLSPPSQEKCCKWIYTCADVDPDPELCTPYYCDPNKGLLTNPNATYKPSPSDTVCCLKKTCANTDPFSATPKRQWCAAGTAYNTSMDNVGPPSKTVCCSPVPVASCADANVTLAGPQPWMCDGAKGLVPKPNATTAGLPSDSTCCLWKTCGDTDPTSVTLEPQSCPAGTQLDANMTNYSPPSPEKCCKPLPSCADTQLPGTAGPQAHVCNETLGWVTNPAASASLNPTDSVCCLKKTCRDMNPLTSELEGIVCENGTIPLSSAANYSPPSQEKCCKWIYTCADVDPDPEVCTPYYCDPNKGLLTNPNATHKPSPSDTVCCLKKTCANTDPFSATPKRQWCAAGTAYNTSMDNVGPPSKTVCCSPVPVASCADANVTLAGPQPWMCDGAKGLVPKPNSGSLAPSDANCCLAKTCADTDPTTAAADPQSCPAGTELDSNKATFSPPSAEQCCKPLPTCDDTNTTLTTDGLQPYDCSAQGLVPNAAAAKLYPPSASTCCLPTCGDANVTATGKQPWECSSGFSRMPGSDLLNPPSDGVCCVAEAPRVLTCGDANATALNTPYLCPEGTTPNSASVYSSPVSTSKCCLATCSDKSVTTPGKQPHTCPDGTLTNAANALATNPSDSVCCLPTCSDKLVTSWGKQPWRCSSGKVVNTSAALASPPSEEVCCMAPVQVPTCSDANTTAPGAQPWVCNATMGLVTKPNCGPLLSPSDATCCLQKTCRDTDPTTTALNPQSCPTGMEPDPNMATYSPPSQEKCCKAKATPASPACTAGSKKCPSPSQVNALISTGMAVSPSTGSGPFTLTYTNNAFLKADCTEGLSWMTLATCNSASSNNVLCKKVGGVKLGTAISLSGVQCGAIVNIVLHDGSFKRASGQQSPYSIKLTGCKAGTQLPSGCRSSDDAGGCGGAASGAYTYQLVCPGQARAHLRRLHFF